MRLAQCQYDNGGVKPIRHRPQATAKQQTADAASERIPAVSPNHRDLDMSSTHHSPVAGQKSISPLEAAAQTALESIADRRFTDAEWRQIRPRLLQFVHVLRQWSQPAPVHDQSVPVEFPQAASPQCVWKEAA
jgi:hypothetical protein